MPSAQELSRTLPPPSAVLPASEEQVPERQGQPDPPAEQTDQADASVASSTVLDRYNYDKTPILLVIQFRPTQDGQPRQIWLSVQNGGVGNEQDSPLYRLLTEAELGGDWPPAVANLLWQLRADLPARQQRYEAKQAQRATSATAPTAFQQGSSTQKPGKRDVKATAKSSPPVPTTATVPKEGMAMDGLFDGLD